MIAGHKLDGALIEKCVAVARKNDGHAAQELFVKHRTLGEIGNFRRARRRRRRWVAESPAEPGAAEHSGDMRAAMPAKPSTVSSRSRETNLLSLKRSASRLLPDSRKSSEASFSTSTCAWYPAASSSAERSRSAVTSSGARCAAWISSGAASWRMAGAKGSRNNRPKPLRRSFKKAANAPPNVSPA